MLQKVKTVDLYLPLDLVIVAKDNMTLIFKVHHNKAKLMIIEKKYLFTNYIHGHLYFLEYDEGFWIVMTPADLLQFEYQSSIQEEKKLYEL
jgi:hypothetical protein